jgi:hypothetical protein
MDEAGKIKRVILQKSTNFNQSEGVVIFYLKFPVIDAESSTERSVVTMNFSVLRSYPLSVYTCTSFYKALIYHDSDNAFMGEVDTSLNHGKHVISSYSLVYYTDAESVRHYYLKLSILYDGGSGKYDIHYEDISTNKSIPEAFTYDNMLCISALPETESQVSNSTVFLRHTALDMVRAGNGASMGVITNWSGENPGKTHTHLYPDSKTTWSTAVQIGTSGFYIWRYAGGM